MDKKLQKLFQLPKARPADTLDDLPEGIYLTRVCQNETGLWLEVLVDGKVRKIPLHPIKA